MESRSGKNNRGGRDEPGHDAVGVVRRLQQLAAMKTKSHGTAFAHPVAPLMWKSGTCHFVDGSCRLCGASGRDVKVR